MRKIFITGTDTNIGKTYISIKLLNKYKKQKLKTIALKPIATGSINGYNQDALLLQENASINLSYKLVNPFSFKPAVSPNIACFNLTADKIYTSITSIFDFQADICLIEGAGGWLTPINSKETMADFIALIDNIEIILVVGIRLGCLNHALLTYRAIKTKKLNIIGWIANIIDPNMEEIDKNINTLCSYIPEPCLEIYPYEYNR